MPSDSGLGRTLAISAPVVILVVLACLINPAAVIMVMVSTAVVVTLLISFFSPRFIWVIFVIAILMDRFTLHLGAIALRPEHFALLLLCASLLQRRFSPKAAVRAKLTVAGICLTLWLVSSTVVSLTVAPEPIRSLYVVILYTLAAASFFLAYRGGDFVWRAQSSTRIVSLVAGLSVISWVLAETAGVATPLVILNNYETTYRAQGFMVEPNFFGGVCVIWLCILYAYRRYFSTRECFVHVSTLSAGVLLSYTRAAWVSLAILIIIVVLQSRAKLFPRVVIGCLGLFLVLALQLPAAQSLTDKGNAEVAINERIAGLFNFESGTGAFRARDWVQATAQLNELRGWVFGLGANSYSQRNISSETSSGEGYLGNFWLSLFYDGGLVAALLVISALIAILSTNISSAAAWALVVTIALTSGATNSLWFMYSWVALALVVAPTGTVRKRLANAEHGVAVPADEWRLVGGSI